ncbi:MAG: hypothetical protein FWC41_13095 [Firmicutes bacterium]|nr:hypothetical protein [Bacillota bacterium]
MKKRDLINEEALAEWEAMADDEVKSIFGGTEPDDPDEEENDDVRWSKRF